MKNCYSLNLQFKPLDDTFSFPVSGGINVRIHHLDTSLLSDSCMLWIEGIGLKLNRALVFETPANNQSYDIHIDGIPPYGRKFGINWNYNIENFEMMWFKPLVKGTMHGHSGVYSLIYKRNEVELIESSNTSTPVLFRTDIPHCVMNYSNKPRYSLSLVFEQMMNWEESVNYFRDYILEY